MAALQWWKVANASRGSVLFPGPLPPPAAQFRRLSQSGFEIEELPATSHVHWALRLSHPALGHGELSAHRDPVIPPDVLFDQCMMTEEERNLARRGTTSVTLVAPGTTGHVLRDRKAALRILSHCLGDYGVAVVDEPALKVWTPAMLDEELAHDAPLDIDGILAVHWVFDPDPTSRPWMHTHGLKEIGHVDFDILDPATELNSSRLWDVMRAMAFAIVEGGATVGGDPFPLINPGGEVALIDSRRFIANGEQTAARRLAELADEFHRESHVVLCDPPATGLLARFRSARYKPSSFLSGPIPDDFIIPFSKAASALMAERARGTYGVLRELRDEFADLDLPVLAKLGYQVDGDADDHEYLWFQVHALGDDWIDATLTNDPFNVSHLRKGERRQHSTELLADWAILTSAGMINPRQMSAARVVRANRHQLLAASAE
jgi:hypothetical protein